MPQSRLSNKKPPASAFSAGKFKASFAGLSGKKDVRNLVFVEGLQQGIMVAYVQKFNKEEEAFIGPHIRHFEDNMDIMETAGINAIIDRKGGDGESPMMQNPSSQFAWKQFVFATGEDNNTKEERARLGRALVNKLNDTSEVTYKYPRKSKFFKDISAPKLNPVDARVLDADVVGLMKAAYPDLTLEEIAQFDSIMAGFWCNVARGKEVMEGFIDSEEEGWVLPLCSWRINN